MGYRIASVAAVEMDGFHAHFAYYIPSLRFEYAWINVWFEAHFDALAARIGPLGGVVIAPLAGREQAYRDSFASNAALALDESFQVSRGTDRRASQILHSGLPLLVVSQRPVGTRNPDAHSADFAAINLAGYDEQGLGRLLDALLAAIAENRDVIDAIPASTLASPQSALVGSDNVAWLVEHGLELKPNVFGIGLNVNAIISWFRDYRNRRR